jgi:hypothetical protein
MVLIKKDRNKKLNRKLKRYKKKLNISVRIKINKIK